MNVLSRIPEWAGITSPSWMHRAISKRNMPVVAVGSAIVALFSAMLAFCLLTGSPCPIDGFDDAAYESEAVKLRYTVTSIVVVVVLTLICVFATLYLKRQWTRTGIATAVTALFAFIVIMLWGIAESGLSADRQILIFASIQFLVAGLIIFKPIVALVFFVATFFMFGEALDLSQQLTDGTTGDLVYLAGLDVIICWVVYGLFATAARRQQSVVDMSRRDELTGAKNRHYLRDDFPLFIGEEIFVMFCDIDNFKHYNDSYGHGVGDYLLRQFYFALREAFGDECTYRYGGDEFLVVSIEFGKGEFNRKLGKVQKQIALVEIEGENAQLTYSGGFKRGVAQDSDTFRTLLHEADSNLLQAKQLGKNRVIGEKQAELHAEEAAS